MCRSGIGDIVVDGSFLFYRTDLPTVGGRHLKGVMLLVLSWTLAAQLTFSLFFLLEEFDTAIYVTDLNFLAVPVNNTSIFCILYLLIRNVSRRVSECRKIPPLQQFFIF